MAIKNSKKVVAIIPAKGSSERIKNKNIRLIDGEHLVVRAIRRAKDSHIFDEVWLDTDSEEIAALCNHLNCKVMMRDKKLASNKTDGNQLLLNEIKHIDADIYCQILCTSPFIKYTTIKNGIDQLNNTSNYDSVIFGRLDKFYEWDSNGNPSYDLDNIPNSIDLEPKFVESMGAYIIKKDTALKYKRRIGNNPLLIDLSPEEAIDVNYDEDLDLANKIATGQKEEENKKIRLLSKVLTSAILSDSLDSISDANHFIKHRLKSNLGNIKLFGRAKTIKLKKIDPEDNYKDIYEAHEIYNHISQNDILVVDNPTDYSFFGELNASMAIRAGASGSVIFGPTRDTEATKAIGFPVFFKEACSQDIRSRGTLESFNKPVDIFGVTINPGQLIFIDDEGLIVLPKDLEKEVIRLSLNNLSNEDSIVEGIISGLENSDLIKKFGDF
jgi:CMP-N-acetylneuraminic acid synthetase/regulator of RNase E activity RraA